MHGSLLFGGSVVVSMVGGVIALLAPCCVSVMLPSYFASAFHNRRTLVAMTFLFGAGVATIILPLALGASALRRAIFGHHAEIYLVGAAFLVGLGVYTLSGGRLRIPQPGWSTSRSGPLGVYTLGVFSGVATSCCAPVLVGVVALSGAASSFVTSLVLGLAYVFGMVAPLFAAALFWDRYGERFTALSRPRTVTYRIGRITRSVSGTALASGTMLIIMGVAMAWIAVHPDAMGTKGWQGALTARIEHYGHAATDALRWLPGWLAIVMLAVVVFALARRAMHELHTPRPASADPISEPAQQGVDTE